MLRLIVILFLAFAPTSAMSDEMDVRDRIVSELRDDGFSKITMYRTFLGRMRFVAIDQERRREIVVHPRTGVILRDYVRFITPEDNGSSSGSSGFGEQEDDDDDDDHDNSGRGSNGDDDDEDDHDDDDDDDDDDDNSGSGSSSSGSDSSGSDDDDDDDD